jgi:hypothetical protein
VAHLSNEKSLHKHCESRPSSNKRQQKVKKARKKEKIYVSPRSYAKLFYHQIGTPNANLAVPVVTARRQFASLSLAGKWCDTCLGEQPAISDVFAEFGRLSCSRRLNLLSNILGIHLKKQSRPSLPIILTKVTTFDPKGVDELYFKLFKDKYLGYLAPCNAPLSSDFFKLLYRVGRRN